MGASLRLRFVTSAPSVEHLPPTDAEVAVIGRSNVGKSSLLNALAGSRDLAKVSSKPGRTRLLNVFAADGGGTVVDLPGYGFAHVSKTERAAWQRRQDAYLTRREGLRLVLALVDGEVGPTKLDVEVLDRLREAHVPLQVVATKSDKVKSKVRVRRRRDLAAGCEVAERDVRWVSAEKGVGLDALRALVRATLAGDDATAPVTSEGADR